MKKLPILTAVVAAVLAMAAAPAGFAGPAQSGDECVPPSATSTKAHLPMYEKNPADFTVVEGGASGKMTYSRTGSTFKFVMNGQDLEAGQDYTLIYYPDPWPGEELICLGADTARGLGNVHISGAAGIGDLPKEVGDENYPIGAKIWLVLTSDVDCGGSPNQMIGWTPEEYLFEGCVITYTETP